MSGFRARFWFRRGVLVGVLALGIGGWKVWERQMADELWSAVERRDLVVSVPIEGELRAVSSVTLGPPQVEDLWQFKISRLATEGEKVEEGDPILTFDPTELRQRLVRTTSERDQAEKELEKKITDLQIERRDLELQLAEARARLRKAEFLLEVPAEVVSRTELETARIDRRLAALEIEALEGNLEYLEVRERLEVGTLTSKRDLAASNVERLQTDMERMVVRAPRSGTLLLISNWQGEKPKVGDSAWRMRKLAEIPDLSVMEGDAEISEADIGRVDVGQVVTFRLDAFPDREVRGRVAQIRRAVQPKSLSNPRKIVRVVLEIDDSDPERFRPGMRFEGRVEIRRLEDVVALPEEAVIAGRDGARVLRRGPWGQQSVNPILGERDDRFFEVLDGLEPGDRVRVDSAGAGT